jgi:hypothetical protein
MPVITVDTLIEGRSRQDVLDWLAEPAHHEGLLRAGFDVRVVAVGQYDLTVRAPGKPVIGYRFRDVDQSHGGRRVLVDVRGKRTDGEMHWSMRTMKPSTNTLVTLHMDYRAGRVLGPILDSWYLRQAMSEGFAAALAALQRELRPGEARAR